MKQKTIIIINGASSAIGSQLFTYFVSTGKYIVWGVSRSAHYYEKFIDENGKLPLANIVFSITDFTSKNDEVVVESFIETIPEAKIVYIHCVGKFLTEMNNKGDIVVKNDNDDDGIDDSVRLLTYELPIMFARQFIKHDKKTTLIQIGSLSDKHKLRVHTSWYRSMSLLKKELRHLSLKYKIFNSFILNVSSVLTVKELMDRPFIDIQTNAEMNYWLPPYEIAKFIENKIKNIKFKFKEFDLFKAWPSYTKQHFTIDLYKERRKNEFYNSLLDKYRNVIQIKDGDNIEFQFHNPYHLDRLWGNLSKLLVEQQRHSQPIVIYNPHEWFFVVRNQAEHDLFSFFEQEKRKMFLVCGSNSKIDEIALSEGFSEYSHEYCTLKKPIFANNYNLNVYGDYIIEVFLDAKVAQEMQDFYKKYTKINAKSLKILKKMVSQKGVNRLVVTRDKVRAEKIRNKLLAYFKNSPLNS